MQLSSFLVYFYYNLNIYKIHIATSSYLLTIFPPKCAISDIHIAADRDNVNSYDLKVGQLISLHNAPNIIDWSLKSVKTIFNKDKLSNSGIISTNIFKRWYYAVFLFVL